MTANDEIFLKNCWYVAAWDHELIDGAKLARTILEQPVVLYRGESGRVMAMEDRCCHRGAPLSMGRVEGDCIRCMYHGMKFDPSGKCIQIPGQEVIPARLGVRSFPIVQRRVVDDQRRIGLGGIAHPDPDQVVAQLDRVAAHAEPRRDHVLAGNLDALAGRVELHAVVHAADAVALDAPHRQRRAAMTAAVVHRDDPAAFALVEDDRLVEDGAGELGAVDQLVVPGRDVPAVLQEHVVARARHGRLHSFLRARMPLASFQAPPTLRPGARQRASERL